FGHATVRKMLARPRYAGLMPDGVSKAAWEPVLDREKWEAVAAALDARAAGRSYATNARKYLLSGIALCGNPSCGKPLQIWQSKGRGNGVYSLGYACVREGGCRKVYRSQHLLDAYVVTRVVARLGRADNPAPRIPELPGLAARFATLTQARTDAAAAVADPSNAEHVSLLLARLKRIGEELAQLRERTADGARAPPVRQH